jgi:hypothetical protein
MNLCARLRWKGYYARDWSSLAELAVRLSESDVPFSCLDTAQPWGPDEALCAPERCGPQRACYRPSPLLPRATLS